ncbi:MAG: hypothetical protein AAGI25_21070 [Bacteroidota bacterium]
MTISAIFFSANSYEVQNSQDSGLIDQLSLGIDKAITGSPFGEVQFTNFYQGVSLHYNLSVSTKREIDLKAG